MPVMVRSLGTIKAEGTHKERSQKRITLALEVCTTTNILAFGMQASAE